MAAVTANLRTGIRDTAQRLGVIDFWRWWIDQLAPLIPAQLRNAVARQRLRPMIVFGRDEATLWELEAASDRIAYVPGARIPLHGEATQTELSGRAAMEALRKRARTGAQAPRVVLALTPQQVLRKRDQGGACCRAKADGGPAAPTDRIVGR